MLDGADAIRVRVELGHQLRRARLRAQLSQRSASIKADMSQPALSNYESGIRDMPLIVVLRLCHAYDLPAPILVADLMTITRA